ncbi:hypothetical protein COBT_002737 [Conglomerata obtusa]
MNITSKNQATALLKNLIRTSQTILNAKQVYQDKLVEVAKLERDFDIGLPLNPVQERTMHSKLGYEIILEWIDKVSQENKLMEIQNEDEFLKLCVECIFLEKREVKCEVKKENKVESKKELVKESVEEIVPEKELKQEVSKEVLKEKINEKKCDEEKKESKENKVKNPPVSIKDEIIEDSINEELGLKARIPYAWKHGQVFEGGKRERKRDTEKKSHIPSKEYRGWNEKKSAH